MLRKKILVQDKAVKRIKFITQKVDALIFLLYKKIWKDLLYLLCVGVGRCGSGAKCGEGTFNKEGSWSTTFGAGFSYKFTFKMISELAFRTTQRMNFRLS